MTCRKAGITEGEDRVERDVEENEVNVQSVSSDMRWVGAHGVDPEDASSVSDENELGPSVENHPWNMLSTGGYLRY